MKRFILLVLLGLITAGCGKGSETNGSNGGQAAVAASSPAPTPDVAKDDCPKPQLANLQYLIPCVTDVSGIPAVLVKSGNSVFLLIKHDGNVEYKYQPVGNYTSADTRECKYHVNSDGSIE